MKSHVNAFHGSKRLLGKSSVGEFSNINYEEETASFIRRDLAHISARTSHT